jgi:hypothetical protein
MCDASKDVPIEKKATQIKRMQSSSFSPYEFDHGTQKAHISEEGLIIDDKVPVLLDMFALMATRSLRIYLYEYFRNWIVHKKWTCKFTLIFDAEFPLIGHQAFRYEIEPGAIIKEESVVHSGTGEGEISALVWALRVKETHSVQLHSGDLDMLALVLLHGHRFKNDLKASLCSRYIFSYREARSEIESSGFTCEDVVLGAVMLGTDFVTKKLVSHRANTFSVFEAARSARLIYKTNDILELLDECDALLLSQMLTAANNVYREDIQAEKLGKTVKICTFSNPVIHHRIIHWIERRQQEMKKFRVNITDEGLMQIKFNINYWVNVK